MTIYAEGIVTIRPATGAAYDRFVDDFIRIELPVLRICNIALAGGWKRSGGTSRQLLNLYSFESLVAMSESGAKQREHAAAMEGLYDWVQPSSFRYRRHVHFPTPFSPPERLVEIAAEKPAAPRQYVEIKRRVLFGKQAEAYELIQAQIAQQEAAGTFRLALSYDTLFGEFGELTVIGILPEGQPSLAYMRDASDDALAEKLSAVVGEEEVHFLNPLPFSPLQ